MHFLRAVLLAAGIGGALATDAGAQFFPPGAFAIDGIPVSCGGVPTIVNAQIPDVALNTGSAIVLNPVAMGMMSTPMKLFIYSHECAHSVQGPNEVAADCWAIRLGRAQGWFPPQHFQELIASFQFNPGDWTHLPGPMRIQNMLQCYGA